MAIACSTSAFRVPLDQALSEVSQLGFSAVDLIAIGGWDHVSLPRLVSDFEQEAGRIERLLQQHALSPVALNAAVPHLHQRNDAVNAERLDQTRAAVRLMQRLGISQASLYFGYKAPDRPWEQVLQDTASSLNEMIEIAAPAGVALLLEPHFNTPFQTVEQALRLLEVVPRLGVAYDPSHFAMQSIDLPATYALLSRAAHVHLRDAAPGEMQAPAGEGTVDFDGILNALAEHDYRGHITIEYLPGEEHPPRQDIARMLQMLQDRLFG